MIKAIMNSDNDEIEKLIFQNMMENPYLYIDTQTYGYTGKNIQTYALIDDNRIYVIFLKYYNTFQIMEIQEPNDAMVKELSEYIIQMTPTMISGNVKLINKIASNIKDVNAKTEYGALIDFTKEGRCYSGNTVLAKKEHYYEIAELICSDSGIGGHYEVEELCGQLIERNELFGYISRIVVCENRVAAHIAVYAEKSPIAILGDW